MNAPNLQDVLKDLDARWRNAVADSMNDLIPPWCTGFQDSFWVNDPVGREFVRLWFQLNKNDAITRSRASKILYGTITRAGRMQDQLIEEYLTQYPAPWWFRRRYMKLNFKGAGNSYFLRSEVMRLRQTILARWAKERRYSKERVKRRR